MLIIERLVELSSSPSELAHPAEVTNAWLIPDVDSLNEQLLIDDGVHLTIEVGAATPTGVRARVGLDAPIQQLELLTNAVGVITSATLGQSHALLNDV